MVTTKLNLSMTEPQVRQIYAKQGDTGRVLDITLDQTPEDGTLRILRPDGTEVTSEAVTGGEVSESGETVTFESMTEADVTELTVGIEPVQDLNGYDAPWVGGAGKNKSAQSTLTTTGGGYINYSCGTFGSAVSGQTYTLSLDNETSSTANMTVRIYNNGTQTNQVYGNLVANGRTSWTFTASVDGEVFISGYISGLSSDQEVFKNIQLELGSSATAYSPYSNICPITGHDEVTVTDEGKNLFDKDNPNTVNGYISTSGLVQSNPNNRMVYIKVTPNSSVTVTFTQVALPTSTARDDVQAGVFGSVPIGGVTGTYKGTWSRASATEDYTYSFSISVGDNDYVGIKIGNTARTDVTASLETLQIEYGTSSTAWTPYQSNTYTTSLGQTVYGGTLDLVSGVLTVTHAIVDLSSLSWTYDGSVPRFFSYGIQNTVKAPSRNSEIADIICTQYISTSLDGGVSIYGGLNGSVAVSTGKVMSVRDEAYTSASTFKDAMEGVMLCYALATPVEYQLTTQQIQTLLGTNNVRASSGDIVNITFTYGGLLSELPSEATSIVGKCYCDVEQNGVSSMPFTLNVKKNERQ